jgi:hypothetical protein
MAEPRQIPSISGYVGTIVLRAVLRCTKRSSVDVGTEGSIAKIPLESFDTEAGVKEKYAHWVKAVQREA